MKFLKDKNNILIIAFCIGLYIVYQLSIKKCMRIYSQYSQISTSLVQSKQMSQQQGFYLKKNIAYDSILQSFNVSDEQNLSNYIFEQIQQTCDKHKVNIVSYKSPHRFKLSGTSFQTSYIFSLKSSFKKTLAALNDIEMKKLGSIVSLDFQKKKDYKTNKTELYCNFILQNVE